MLLDSKQSRWFTRVEGWLQPGVSTTVTREGVYSEVHTAVYPEPST